MATVYGLGTAWLGIGIRTGVLIITAIHITILTTYYWILSPIGLPSSPEWLDFERTWLTGLPVHFGVYFLGYLVALWLWNQRATQATQLPYSMRRTAGAALATAVGVVVAAGLLQTLLLHEIPQVTWFIVRIAVAFPFTLAWWKMAGEGTKVFHLGRHHPRIFAFDLWPFWELLAFQTNRSECLKQSTTNQRSLVFIPTGVFSSATNYSTHSCHWVFSIIATLSNSESGKRSLEAK